ncbi:hypothetical protein PTTG_07595 [Puccinia triticina 1-1 BBBD Race 1]|uniref:Uncharacterized protein n=1 Tax=Puccinia triticina (isolate 1-1 / race 1 (BBBD)) TaxID=630390 RepID=A0A180GCR9_PUCT1|nr:hypothetical protein PTTG_07595 [Puccinia triticina 1-1 BBBD Race 1]
MDTNIMEEKSLPAREKDDRGSSQPTPNARSVGLFKSLIIIFSFTSKLDYVLLVLPAFLLSVLSGLLPAYMTILVGQAFQLFADYTIATTGAPDSPAIIAQAKDTLRQKIGEVAIKLVCLGGATFLLSLVTHTLWAINGSKICEKIQAAVYDSVSQRELGWFENGMKTRYQFSGEESANKDSCPTDDRSATSQSPAGLMARFARQTEDIRAAISGRMGMIIQYTVTLLVNTILAFTKSYKLSLVILCTIPVVTILTALSAKLTGPLFQKHSFLESALSTEIGRMVKTISIVKAFSAQPLEIVKLVRLSSQLSKNYVAFVRILAVRLGICQCLSLLMFVQGFGFGSKLITAQEVTTGDVNTVFWSCLVASSYLQMLMPMLTFLEKAQLAILNLIALMDQSSGSLSPKSLEEAVMTDYTSDTTKPPNGKSDSPPKLVPLSTMQQSKRRSRGLIHSWSPTASTVTSSSTNNLNGEKLRNAHKISSCGALPTQSMISNAQQVRARTQPAPPEWRLSRKTRMRHLRKLIPADFKGQLELKAVTFYYPSNEPTFYNFPPKASTLITQTPNKPNLDDVSMFFPSGDFTFIIGESGSGKSTISAVLMGLFPIMKGSVEADELGSIGWLDPNWYRNQFCLVSGLTSMFLLPGTLHENIAIGVGSTRDWRSVSRLEVVRAAKFALLHEFISDLPQGYDTKLDSETDEQTSGNELPSGATGSKGVQSLSGGQKQRLGLARAWIRNAPILILDEATSALDLTTQALMYDAIRQWRSNKTTICITHDLKPIGPKDYVYVMQAGRIVLSDYRYKLEGQSLSTSLFKQMARKSPMVIASKVKFESSRPRMSDQTWETIDTSELQELEEIAANGHITFSVPPNDGLGSQSNNLPGSRKRMTFLDGFIHALKSDGSFLGPQQSGLAPGFSSPQNAWRRSARRAPPEEEDSTRERRPSLRSSFSAEELTKNSSQKPRGSRYSRYSMDLFKLNGGQHAGSKTRRSKVLSTVEQEDDEYREFTASVMLQASKIASSRRNQLNSQIDCNPESAEKLTPERRKKWSPEELANVESDRPGVPHEPKYRFGCKTHHKIDIPTSTSSTWSIPQLFKNIAPTLNQKWLTLFGCLVSIASGTMTPLFSVVLGNLLGKIANPPPGFLLKNSIYIIVIAIADGILAFLRVFIMEKSSTMWLESMRSVAFEKIVLQDQEWFDQTQNSPANLINRLIKDGADCKDLIGQILADILTVLTLITLTFVWALVIGWQLTLVGLSLAPVFFFIVGGSGKLSSKFELLNKILREQVANQFHLTISNTKAIRAMSLEPLMRERFIESSIKSRKMFIRSAPLHGISSGLNIAMTYLADGLLFYVGAVLVIKGLYTFEKLLQVFSLIIFSVTFAGQIVGSVPSFSKSVRASMDLIRLVSLPIGSKETKGDLRIPLMGQIEFRQVDFTYPSRPDVPVLKGVSFVVQPGECVGIVGASGSGKSTIAALLHRLYEPNSGSVRLDGFNISQIDARHVREQVGMVTQHAVLFNATVFENISYGHMPRTRAGNNSENMKKHIIKTEVEPVIEQVHLTEFVDRLPLKLDTKIGENSDLISSGQAQRLSIARTLLNKNRKILVFDECTSALDAINQTEILKTIMEIKIGKTSVIITHKEDVMKLCDRLIVMDRGHIVEQGTYQELIVKQNGFLSTLSKCGEYTV